MTIQTYIILISWASFLLYWIISAFNVKKDVRGRSAWAWSHYGPFSRLILIAIIVTISALNRRPYHIFGFMDGAYNGSAHPVIASIAALLVASGIAFAIWARIHLGRNWSSYPSLKENHELITSGPYKIVRHPIYTGILLAIIGSGLAGDLWWVLVFFFAVIVFVTRIYREEKIMTQEFPQKYPDYKKRTWALIPFIF